MNWNKRDTVRTVIILCGVVLFAYVLFNFDKVSSMFSWLINILMPFVIGFAIAFVVNVPMKGLEKVLFKNKDSRLYRFRRPVCLILSFLCIIAVLTFAITMIIPEMSKTITMFAEKLPSAMDDIQRKAIKLMKDQPEIVDKIKSININWDALISNVVGIVKNGGSSVLSSTFSIASSVVGAVVDVLVGLFFACYILAQKETLEKQVKGVLYAVFREEKADRFIQTCVLADKTFSKFISGQCLEACILGLMFFTSGCRTSSGCRTKDPQRKNEAFMGVHSVCCSVHCLLRKDSSLSYLSEQLFRTTLQCISLLCHTDKVRPQSFCTSFKCMYIHIGMCTA